MSASVPIYTSDNCRAAYQLNWSLALFSRQPVVDSNWLSDLKRAAEPDGVRVLEHRFAKPGVSQLLVSTRPETAPERLVWSVKGRLQHLVRRQYPRAFQRNYGLRSVGSAAREAIEGYVRSQVTHHPMADPRCRRRFAPSRSIIPASICRCPGRMRMPASGTCSGQSLLRRHGAGGGGRGAWRPP